MRELHFNIMTNDRNLIKNEHDPDICRLNLLSYYD